MTTQFNQSFHWSHNGFIDYIYMSSGYLLLHLQSSPNWSVLECPWIQTHLPLQWSYNWIFMHSATMLAHSGQFGHTQSVIKLNHVRYTNYMYIVCSCICQPLSNLICCFSAPILEVNQIRLQQILQCNLIDLHIIIWVQLLLLLILTVYYIYYWYYLQNCYNQKSGFANLIIYSSIIMWPWHIPENITVTCIIVIMTLTFIHWAWSWHL